MDLFSQRRSPEPQTIGVTQLLRRMKHVLETGIGELWVEGEISNLKRQASGHWYFSLKDDGAQIQCAMFGARRKAGFEALEDGAKVRVFAEATVYEARGQLQLIVQKAERAGLGELQARFEALKRKLQAEGLFDQGRKRPIPQFPETIGIITSGSGAAIRDILNVLARRAPWVQPVLFPVRVQGRGAEHEIAEAIRKLGRPEAFGYPRCDVLIVGRGGGSLEDLWCFNEEVVARAISNCPVPILSAVGHEIDFTIADFVADLRAPTPSAAAELAVPDGAELALRINRARRRLIQVARSRIERAALQVEALRRGPLRRDAERLLREPAMQLDALRERIAAALAANLGQLEQRLAKARSGHRAHHPHRVLERRLDHVARLREQLLRCGKEAIQLRSEQLARLRDMLRALGPDSTFRRGFSITTDAAGRIVRSVAEAPSGTLLTTRLLDGSVVSRVQ
jgi:exodeoxyribonuclease VII large subunit